MSLAAVGRRLARCASPARAACIQNQRHCVCGRPGVGLRLGRVKQTRTHTCPGLSRGALRVCGVCIVFRIFLKKLKCSHPPLQKSENGLASARGPRCPLLAPRRIPGMLGGKTRPRAWASWVRALRSALGPVQGRPQAAARRQRGPAGLRDGSYGGAQRCVREDLLGQGDGGVDAGFCSLCCG